MGNIIQAINHIHVLWLQTNSWMLQIMQEEECPQDDAGQQLIIAVVHGNDNDSYPLEGGRRRS